MKSINPTSLPKKKDQKLLYQLLHGTDNHYWIRDNRYSVTLKGKVNDVRLTHDVFKRDSSKHPGSPRFEAKANEAIGDGGFAVVYQTTSFRFDNKGNYVPSKKKRVTKTYIPRASRHNTKDKPAEEKDCLINNAWHEKEITPRVLKLKKPVVYQFSEDPYNYQIELVEKFVPGLELIHIVENEIDSDSEEKSLSRDQIIHITNATLQALVEQVSTNKLIHADLSAQNIMVDVKETDDVDVTIIDYGLSRRIDDWSPCESLGTLPYSSPEFVQTGRLNPTCDTFSLAIGLGLLWHTNPGYLHYGAKTEVELTGLVERLYDFASSKRKELLTLNDIFDYFELYFRESNNEKANQEAIDNCVDLIDSIKTKQVDDIRRCIKSLFGFLKVVSSPDYDRLLNDNSNLKSLSRKNKELLARLKTTLSKQLSAAENLKNRFREQYPKIQLNKPIYSPENVGLEKDDIIRNIKECIVALAEESSKARIKLLNGELFENEDGNLDVGDLLLTLLQAHTFNGFESLAVDHLLFLHKLTFPQLGKGLKKFSEDELSQVKALFEKMASYDHEKRINIIEAIDTFQDIFGLTPYQPKTKLMSKRSRSSDETEEDIEDLKRDMFSKKLKSTETVLSSLKRKNDSQDIDSEGMPRKKSKSVENGDSSKLSPGFDRRQPVFGKKTASSVKLVNPKSPEKQPSGKNQTPNKMKLSGITKLFRVAKETKKGSGSHNTNSLFAGKSKKNSKRNPLMGLSLTNK